MRELLAVVICAVVGVGLAWGRYAMSVRGEVNDFSYEKTIGLDKDVAVAAQVAAANAKQPEVEVVDGAIYNFGSMDKGETRSHRFVIRNVGEGVLRLKLLSTSCKCTLSKFNEATVQPGESIDVDLEWKSQDYLDSFSQNATLQTNDPDHRNLELRVMGAVVVAIRPNPEFVAVGTFQVANGFDASVDIYGHKSDSLEVVSWTWNGGALPEGLAIVTEPIAADDPVRQSDESIRSGVRVRLVGSVGLPIGPLGGKLQLSTEPPAPEPIEVSVSGLGVGPITVDTHRRVPYDSENNLVYLGQIGSGQTKDVEISLMVRGDNNQEIEVTIDSAEISPSSHLRAEILPKQALGNVVRVPLKLTIDGAAGSISRLGPSREEFGKIVIRTNDPSTPVIELYVKFAVTF